MAKSKKVKDSDSVADDNKSSLLKVLKKRALGYTAKDENEEYAIVDGVLELVKRKVSYKEVLPDMSAIKMLLDECKEDTIELNEAELIKERDRLLKILFAESISNEKSSSSSEEKVKV